MCGRFACCLDPGILKQACCYYDPETKTYKQSEWREHPAAGDPEAAKKHLFFPCANMAPTQFSPVMFQDQKERVLQPMLWGMIPPWHQAEDPKTHRYSTINARIEGLERSRLYKRAVNARQYCAIVAQGFYEWNAPEGKAKKMPKIPYFLCMKQDREKGFIPEDAGDEAAWKRGKWSENEGWNGPKIMYMAGLYDIWNSPKGEMICSFTIITTEPTPGLKWMHNRFPAILESPEQLEAWLKTDPEEDIEKHLSILKPASALEWYTVRPKVGDARCKDIDCAKRYDIQEPQQPKIETAVAGQAKEEEKKFEEPPKTEEKPAEETVEKVEKADIPVEAEKKPEKMEEVKPKEKEKPIEVEQKPAEEVKEVPKEPMVKVAMETQEVKVTEPAGKENIAEVKSKTTEDINSGRKEAGRGRKRRAISEEAQAQPTAKQRETRGSSKVSAA